MYLIYEYYIRIIDWEIYQNLNEKFILNNQETSLSPRFTYNLTLDGEKYNLTVTAIPYKIPAYNFFAFLEINLPDKEFLYNFSTLLND